MKFVNNHTFATKPNPLQNLIAPVLLLLCIIPFLERCSTTTLNKYADSFMHDRDTLISNQTHFKFLVIDIPY